MERKSLSKPVLNLCSDPFTWKGERGASGNEAGDKGVVHAQRFSCMEESREHLL